MAWRKTAAWAARSRYQNGTEVRLRNQAKPPTSAREEVEQDQRAADDEVDRQHLGNSSRKGRNSAC